MHFSFDAKQFLLETLLSFSKNPPILPTNFIFFSFFSVVEFREGWSDH
jgi:hypothetical protein